MNIAHALLRPATTQAGPASHAAIEDDGAANFESVLRGQLDADAADATEAGEAPQSSTPLAVEDALPAQQVQDESVIAEDAEPQLAGLGLALLAPTPGTMALNGPITSSALADQVRSLTEASRALSRRGEGQADARQQQAQDDTLAQRGQVRADRALTEASVDAGRDAVARAQAADPRLANAHLHDTPTQAELRTESANVRSLALAQTQVPAQPRGGVQGRFNTDASGRDTRMPLVPATTAAAREAASFDAALASRDASAVDQDFAARGEGFTALANRASPGPNGLSLSLGTLAGEAGALPSGLRPAAVGAAISTRSARDEAVDLARTDTGTGAHRAELRFEATQGQFNTAFNTALASGAARFEAVPGTSQDNFANALSSISAPAGGVTLARADVQTVAMHVPVPVTSAAFAPALGQRLIVLASNPGETIRHAEMRLDPPELGPLRVSLTLQGEQASAVFFAAHPTTRAALEAALPQLQQQLADAGIQLGQSSVGEQHDVEQHARQARGNGNARGDEAQADSGEIANESTTRRSVPARGLIDTFA